MFKLKLPQFWSGVNPPSPLDIVQTQAKCHEHFGFRLTPSDTEMKCPAWPQPPSPTSQPSCSVQLYSCTVFSCTVVQFSVVQPLVEQY